MNENTRRYGHSMLNTNVVAGIDPAYLFVTPTSGITDAGYSALANEEQQARDNSCPLVFIRDCYLRGVGEAVLRPVSLFFSELINSSRFSCSYSWTDLAIDSAIFVCVA